jgi:hypothetical protein
MATVVRADLLRALAVALHYSVLYDSQAGIMCTAHRTLLYTILRQTKVEVTQEEVNEILILERSIR